MGNKLTVSPKLVKFLTFSRKSHHPTETLRLVKKDPLLQFYLFSIGLNYRRTLYIKLPLGAFLKCINQCFLEKASNSSFPLLLRMRLEMLCTAN